MAPLQGATLGERQRHLNSIVRAADSNTIPNINFDDDDVDNLARIDCAARSKNVDYILNVLKCEDMLYVTRAIKRTKWLATDTQFHHIIEPKNLHLNLFPYMTAKAIHKLLLNIRLNLKDETLAEHFYSYLNEKTPAEALKWLPLCSINFMHKIVKTRYGDLTPDLIKRLCRRSLNVIEIIIAASYHYESQNIFRTTSFLIKSLTQEYLDIFESSSTYYHVDFNARHTEIIMKKCPQRIIENFNFYKRYIDIETFAKFVKKGDIKHFIRSNNDSCWLTFDNLKYFLVKLPREEVIDFLQSLYGISDSDSEDNDTTALFYAMERKHGHTAFKDVYRWYEFAPFEIALNDLRKYIYAESSPEERHSMLIVLLKCAGRDLTNAKTVISYYHDKHINEPYIHKINFVNEVLTQFDVFKFEEDLWSILNDIFHSLEVYIESGNKVQLCVKNIIIYNVINDSPVHEIVEQKFAFDTLKTFKSKLNSKEQENLFGYLYNLLFIKLSNERLGSETSMNESINILSDMWTLVKDWNKQSSHHEYIIQNIAKLCAINKQNCWGIDMTHLYQMVKPYQRHLIEKSIDLCPSLDVCINILKHNPELLKYDTNKLEDLCCNVDVSLNKFLSKLRIYWADSLGHEWSDMYMKLLEKFTGHKALVRGIFVLFPRSRAMEFIKKYVPTEDKIHWSEADELELSLRRHIAKSMHLVRPQLTTDVVLWYAKGDYLQHSLLSINTIYYNLRSKDIDKHIQDLLNAPVSLQKHGIRLAFNKMKTDELQSISKRLWKSTRNSSIRAILFKLLFEMLCKEKTTSAINTSWEILSLFMDDLNQEENKTIYDTLSLVEKVPIQIRGTFYMKSFLFLKSLPPKADCENNLWRIIHHAEEYIEYLDDDFVENSLLEALYDILSKDDYHTGTYRDIMVAYLLCSQNEDIQMKKYKNLLAPVLEKCSLEWVNGGGGTSLSNFEKMLYSFGYKLSRFVFENNMVLPVSLLEDILQSIKKLNKLEKYVMLTHWELFVAYLKMLDKIMKNTNENTSWSDWPTIRSYSTKQFSEVCLQYLKKDINIYFPSIYLLFGKALKETFNDLDIEYMDLINVLDGLLECKDIEVYMLCLDLCPSYCWRNESELIILKQKIYSHPSQEIKMHTFNKFGNSCKKEDNEENASDTEGSSESDDDSYSEENEDDAEVSQAKPRPIHSYCTLT